MDRYVKGRVVGKGAYATVFQATHRETAQKVALKLLDLDKVHDLDEVLNEVNLMRMATHKNVLPLLDSFSEARYLYIVTELCNYGSLSDLLKVQPKIPEKVAVVIMNQMLQGIEYIHGLGWVHQDIKAANLLFHDKGQVKLCDFGVACEVAPRSSGEETPTPAAADDAPPASPHWQEWFTARRASKAAAPTTALAGTPYYMAPEVVAQRGEPATPGDMWSAGIVWVQMLSGTLPHASLHPMKAMVTIAQSEPPSLRHADVSDKAVLVAEACLQRAPQERTTAAALLKNKLIAKGKKPKALAAFLAATVKAGQASLAADDDYDSGDEDERPAWAQMGNEWLYD